MKKIIFVALLFTILSPISVSAHQPRLVEQNTTVVQDPEVSQAFYGQLQGEPQYYKISSGINFDFYINILVPDLPNSTQDFSVAVTKIVNGQDENLTLLDGQNYQWQYFFEDYAGDGYYKGPEYRAKLAPGDYTLKVFNPDNQGKYSLAIGQKESFPPSEMLHTLLVLPELKTQFFDKPFYLIFYNRVGLYLGALISVLAAVVIGIIFIIRAAKRRKTKDIRIEKIGGQNLCQTKRK